MAILGLCTSVNGSLGAVFPMDLWRSGAPHRWRAFSPIGIFPLDFRCVSVDKRATEH
jgi:hypothetical protein